jgi:hypothetical protein
MAGHAIGAIEGQGCLTDIHAPCSGRWWRRIHHRQYPGHFIGIDIQQPRCRIIRRPAPFGAAVKSRKDHRPFPAGRVKWVGMITSQPFLDILVRGIRYEGVEVGLVSDRRAKEGRTVGKGCVGDNFSPSSSLTVGMPAFR